MARRLIRFSARRRPLTRAASWLTCHEISAPAAARACRHTQAKYSNCARPSPHAVHCFVARRGPAQYILRVYLLNRGLPLSIHSPSTLAPARKTLVVKDTLALG